MRIKENSIGSMRKLVLDVISNSLGVEFEHRTDPKLLAALISRLRPKDVGGGLFRLGGNRDGAYLLPKQDLVEIDGCISPGVGHSITFEKDLNELLGTKTVLVDPGGEEISSQLPNSTHIKKFLSGRNIGDSSFLTLEDVTDEHFPEAKNLLLQMDIEGSEYGVLLSANKQLLSRFLIIIIEFHDINRWKKSTLFETFYKPSIQNLLTSHSPVHLHPNSYCGSFRLKGTRLPQVFELTLIRNDSPNLCDYFSHLPNELDIDFHSGKRLEIDFSYLDQMANSYE